MRRIATAVALIVCLHRGALADSATNEPTGAATTVPAIPPTTPTPSTSSTASSQDPRPEYTPIDDPAKLEPETDAEAEPSPWRKRGAALTLGAIYAGFSAWSYVAWYQTPRHDFLYDNDPSDGYASRSLWLGSKSYAGGADKLGHLWSTYALARAGTEILRTGGFDDWEASLIGAGLSELLFLAVEIVDGYHYVFSNGDLAYDTLGAGLAVLQSAYPRFDEMFDFRVEYWPSKAYRDHTDADFAEDYSGQTFHVAFHLGSIPKLREGRWSTWSRFVDVDLGFKSRGYKPDPPWEITEEMPDYEMKQTLSLGVAINLQGVFDYLLEDRAPTARKLAHGAFELFSPPYTTLPLASASRSPTGPIPPSPF